MFRTCPVLLKLYFSDVPVYLTNSSFLSFAAVSRQYFVLINIHGRAALLAANLYFYHASHEIRYKTLWQWDGSIFRDRRVMDLYQHNRMYKKYNPLSMKVDYHGDISCYIPTS